MWGGGVVGTEHVGSIESSFHFGFNHPFLTRTGVGPPLLHFAKPLGFIFF